MVSKAKSIALYGLEGILIEVEADVFKGEERFDIVGLPDTAVKESKERVHSAIKNTTGSFPYTTITVNLAPADVKKEGAYLDLPIAVTILRAVNNKLIRDIGSTVFIGELSLEGRLRPVSGILPIVLFAKKQGLKRIVLPSENAKEASLVSGVEIIPVGSLKEVIEYLSGADIDPYPFTQFNPAEHGEYVNDLKYVKGQAVAKRALEVAVSGGHNMIMVGAPGSGKTMLAKCIPSIIPDMTFDEALETTAIYSVYGTLDKAEGVISKRPFVTPHHTSTNVAMVGGGSNSKPGLVSLAHNGVLYLDEMPEYTRQTLECLRQPLEDGVITVSRAKATIKYPADFMLVASMNPCPCGNYGSTTAECKCTDTQIRKYKAKISGPLLDRIDIQIHVDNVLYDDLVKENLEESSEAVRKRVNKARLIQRERFLGEGITCNAQMREKHLIKYCSLSKEDEQLLKRSFEVLGFSARARSRILKVARTIADLDYSDNIETKHLLEAIGYRNSDIDK
ncbi:MAG: YifB family Mg chelatase-like AAA ATPase [Clostridia bacterium]|nr:YifB family Mg chelatase-like AAA ATPase [Clostridia bacterium]